MYSLFNKHPRKYHVRNGKRSRRRIHFEDVQSRLEDLLVDYRSTSFNYRLRTFIVSLPKKCLLGILHVVETVQLQDNIPSRVIRDLITHRRSGQATVNNSVRAYENCNRGVLIIYFHNKGLEILNLPGILSRK